MFSKTVKTFFSWCLAVMIAILCANLISFFYRSGAGSIPRANAYSENIRTPNSRIVRGSEGYGINYADENGYMNLSSLPLSDDYILFMGSSHLEGLQVMQRQNMVSLLNAMLDEDTRTVYNLGTAGFDLPLIIKGFQAAIEEFPDSSAVIIEVSQLDYDSSEIKESLVQAQFAPSSSGEALVSSQSTLRQIRNATLSVLPVISLLRQQFESISIGFDGAFGVQWSASDAAKAVDIGVYDAAVDEAAADVAVDEAATASDDFLETLNQAFALLRAEYDNPIILLYHPRVSLRSDGSITIDRNEQYYADYLTACENNDFVFLDVGDAFLSAYESDYSLPYGFNNTTMGSGHLNTLGHQIIAEELYKTLTELQDKEKK